MKIRSKLSE